MKNEISIYTAVGFFVEPLTLAPCATLSQLSFKYYSTTATFGISLSSQRTLFISSRLLSKSVLNIIINFVVVKCFSKTIQPHCSWDYRIFICVNVYHKPHPVLRNVFFSPFQGKKGICPKHLGVTRQYLHIIVYFYF